MTCKKNTLSEIWLKPNPNVDQSDQQESSSDEVLLETKFLDIIKVSKRCFFTPKYHTDKIQMMR